MKDFIENADRRHLIEVQIRSCDEDNWGYGERVTFRPPATQIDVIFHLPGEASTIEGVALMYYQFDKFMKERYGSHIEEYMKWQRSRRIETEQPEQEAGKV